jgi:hypothetical protein
MKREFGEGGFEKGGGCHVSSQFAVCRWQFG